MMIRHLRFHAASVSQRSRTSGLIVNNDDTASASHVPSIRPKFSCMRKKVMIYRIRPLTLKEVIPSNCQVMVTQPQLL